MPEITCDEDLPKLLNTPTKQVKWAKKLIVKHLGSAVDRVDRPPMQGMFSRTFFLILKDKQQFKDLPLWVAHYDLNEVNVLIDEDCNVTGLIDWELSTPLPFGICFGRIHTYAGEYSGGEFCVPDEFEDAERAFWHELFDGMPTEIHRKLKGEMNLVQDAVILGTLLDCLAFENGKVIVGNVAKKALPNLLTEQIPFIRGQGPPYRD
ncbi:hypothetical protein VN97_g9909 [Penicillium thymicola]|uniref:Aminoglycoside phosphotransferase domain-containing protein n=1 Tax=Penicillium thymicola TaxID=293382 RepID=A0AAI9TA11_PENTH|nr:hypothetical protein VN97_g9909 [Penicillium thymicola]